MGRARDLANFGSNGRINGNIGVNVDPTAPLHVESPDNSDIMRMTVTGNEMWAFRGASGVGSDDYVSFGISGGTEAIRWHETGIVKKPNQPSFWAYMSQSNPIITTNNAKIPYSATLWNVGSHFDTTNSRFVAPIAGKYCFQVNHNVYALSDDQWFRTRVYVNGSDFQILGYMRARGGGDHTTNDSFLLNMSANDYVEIYTNSPDSSYALSATTGWNSFSGFLIG